MLLAVADSYGSVVEGLREESTQETLMTGRVGGCKLRRYGGWELKKVMVGGVEG